METQVHLAFFLTFAESTREAVALKSATSADGRSVAPVSSLNAQERGRANCDLAGAVTHCAAWTT